MLDDTNVYLIAGVDKAPQTLQFAPRFPRFERLPHSPRERAFHVEQRMASAHHIIEAIDTAPLNRGLKGADWLARPGNIPITFENGDVALFDHEGDGVYQGHFLFKSRGRKAIEHAREAFARMFIVHGCLMIFGMVPDFRRDAKMVVRWAGGRSAGVRWASEGPGLPDTKFELFVLSKTQWKVARS